MCGVIGYVGHRQAYTVLLDSLARLEYRGYDSCGIAVLDGQLEIFKDAVRVETLSSSLQPIKGTFGIGHTRWATCGKPTKANAHPHTDCAGNIAIVHNGTINNHLHLKKSLQELGHQFTSETDSEVIAHLIEAHYQGDLVEAVRLSLAEIDGSYAIIAVHLKEQNKLVAARRGSPLIIGLGQGEYWVASDVPAIMNYTNEVIYLEEDELAVLTQGGIRLWHGAHEKVPEIKRVEWSPIQAQKTGYQHFMLKEIHEQPRILRQSAPLPLTMTEKDSSLINLLATNHPASLLILACGTSYHAGLVAKSLIEDLLGIPVNVELASEFNYRRRHFTESLALIITQSGETADALLAMSRLKQTGVKMIAMTNVPGCTACRLADETWYTGAGPEISVAATKSFIGQLKTIYQMLLASSLIDRQLGNRLTISLRLLPSAVQQLLDEQTAIKECARYLAKFKEILFIGRGLNYPIALEGALKLKEIAYISANAYAGGELKHGPLALLSTETPVVAIVDNDTAHEAMLTTIREIKVRGAPIIAVTQSKESGLDDFTDFIIPVPDTDSLTSPVVNTVALQLLAYYTALELGCPIDTPRNLAKSVTVE